MKVKTLFLCLLFISLFSIPAFSQSVVITPKKVTYKRPKPESEYKKTFEITYPKVKAATPALSKKIEDTISYQKNNKLHFSDRRCQRRKIDENILRRQTVSAFQINDDFLIEY